MTKLTNAEKDKLDNTCGNLRVTKLGTHVKSLEDFVNQGVLATQANDVTAAINELYGLIVNNDCATLQIPPPGFFTLFGNDEDGKLYVYYNNEDNPPVFQHIEDEEDDLNGTLYLYIADPEGENHYQMEIGHYIAVSHLDDYYTKTQSNTRFGVTVEKLSANATTAGYAATYVVKQNGSQVGSKIDIPKDFFLKGGSVKTCSTANVPVQGYAVGDKYLDMEINVDDGGATTKHMYILVKDLAAPYTADESTLTLSNTNVFSVKDGGITMTKLATAVQNTINSKADAGSFIYQKVSALAEPPSGTVDDTIYYLTTADIYNGYEPGFYVWDTPTNTFMPFHKNNRENKSNKVTSISSSSTNDEYPSAKLLYDKLILKQDVSTAFSGDYDDLTNKPSIPAKLSDLINDLDLNSIEEVDHFPTSEVPTAQEIEFEGIIYYLSQDDNASAYGNFTKGFYVFNPTIHNFVKFPVDISGKENASNKVTSISSSSTNTQYPSAKLLYDQLALKQNVSSAFSGNYNDLTNKPTIPSKTSDLTNDSGFISSHQDISGKEDTSNKVTSISSSSTNTQYPSAKLLYDQLALKQNASTAFSGNYNDLSNKPTIPSKTSDLTNDGDGNNDFITKSSTSGFIKNDGSVDTNTYLTQHQDITGKEDKTNKVSSWSSTTTDTHYPSEKLVKDALDEKVDGITFINSISDAINDGIYILTSFTLETEDLTMQYGDGSQFIATLLDNGEPYAVGEKVVFTMGGIDFERTIDANGQAKLTVALVASPDPYTITTSFRGKTNTNTITINP